MAPPYEGNVSFDEVAVPPSELDEDVTVAIEGSTVVEAELCLEHTVGRIGHFHEYSYGLTIGCAFIKSRRRYRMLCKHEVGVVAVDELLHLCFTFLGSLEKLLESVSFIYAVCQRSFIKRDFLLGERIGDGVLWQR